MKIIKEIDSRYKLLDTLYHKYNYDNLIKGDNMSTYYYIPPELVINIYETVKVYITSDLDDPNLYKENSKLNWVGCVHLNKYLQKCCNLTNQEYFDLLILHINDTELRPKCKWCGSELPWRSQVRQGYQSGVHWNRVKDINRLFCTQSCFQYYKYSHQDEFPTVDFTYSNWISATHTDESNIKAHMNSFISSGEPSDECYFYITKLTDGKYKYGISQDLFNRSVAHRRKHYSEFINPHILFIFNRINAAYFEAGFKLRYGCDEYLSYSDLNDFYKNLRKYKKEFKDLTKIPNPFN